MTFFTQFSAQLRRDLAEWWTLWAAAVFAGLVPVLLPSLYSAQGEEALDLRVAAMAVGGGLFWLASLGLLGDGLAARDLGEGRMGFFLVRPLSARAFWLARVVAALVLMTVILVSLILPVWLTQPPTAASSEPALDPWTTPVTAPGMDLQSPSSPYYAGERTLSFLRWLAPVGILGALVSLLLMAHLASVAGRSRDAWTLLDLGGFFVVALLALAARDTLLSAQAFGALVAAERLFPATAAGILLVAGARQVARGRTDLRRGHGIFSRTAWPLLALAALAFLGAARWIASPSPDDLRSADLIHPSRDGRLALIQGQAAHRFGLRTGVIFSGDGSTVVTGPVAATAASAQNDRVAWTRCRSLSILDCEVWTWSAGDPDPAPRGTGIFVGRWDHQLAWSPQGELLALVHDKVEVWAPGKEPRLVYAYSSSDGTWPAFPTFLSAGRLRFLTTEPAGETCWIQEVDLPSRTVRTVGQLPGEMPIHLATSSSGRFVLGASMMPSGLALVDTETAEIHDLRTQSQLQGFSLVSARFAGDEGLYLLVSKGGAWRLLHADLLSGFDIFGLDTAGLNISGFNTVTEIPLPPLAPGSEPRLGTRGGALLLSGQIDDGSNTKPKWTLPDGVETLDGHSLWRLDASTEETTWQKLADGVRILYDFHQLAPQRDTATLIGGGGAVLRLGDDRLHRVVPALPGTRSDRPILN